MKRDSAVVRHKWNMGAESVPRRQLFLLAGVGILSGKRSILGQDAAFVETVNVVDVFVTVRNEQGQLIEHLSKEEFSLDEDGATQTIQYFSEDPTVPLTLGLLVDVSLSQRRVLDAERIAAHRFLNRMLRGEQDRAVILQFARSVQVLQDLTSSRKELKGALAAIRSGEDQEPWEERGWRGRPYNRRRAGSGLDGTGTSLYDAVELVADKSMSSRRGRKAVVVLTDGIDNASAVNIGDSIRAALSSRDDDLFHLLLRSAGIQE